MENANGKILTLYLSHSTSGDYQGELYKPLQDSILLKGHELILPHEDGIKMYPSEELFKSGKVDIALFDLSNLSRGRDIEYGFARVAKPAVQLVALLPSDMEHDKYYEGRVNDTIIYNNLAEMVTSIEHLVEKVLNSL